ncbi:AsmA family protein [Candidatus Poribacteria bacterium]|nr:AsmA family protein [Candidatus Poribacteria bacterium]
MLSKWLKWALIAVAVVIVVAATAVYVILSRYDYNALKPKVGQTVLDATGRELKMGGDIKLDIGLKPALSVDNVSFRNAPWGSRPEMASVKRLEVQVALLPLIGGNIEFKRLILLEPEILIETNKSGESNLKFEKPHETAKPKEDKPAKTEFEMPALTFNDVRIENGRLAYKNARSGKSYSVALDSLKARSRSSNAPVEIEIKGAFNGSLSKGSPLKGAPFNAKGTIGPIKYLFNRGNPWPVKLTAKAGGATLSLDGSIKDVTKARGMNLGVAAEGQSVREIAKMAGVRDVPEMGPFKLDVKISDPSEKTYRLSDLQLSLGPSDLAGSAEIALADERPFVTALLKSKRLDLRALSPERAAAGGSATATSKPKAKKDKVFSDTPLPLDALHKIGAKAEIKADRILLPQAALDNVATSIEIKNGALVAEPVTASIGGGSFKGGLDLRAGGDSADFSLRLDVADLDLARMLRELNAKDIMQGNLNASIDVRGHGKSVAGLMGSLDGKTITYISDGQINNKYVDLLGANLGSGVLRLLNPLAQKESHTKLECFVSRFDINDGLAESTVLVMNTNKMSVLGVGRVNLKTEGIDFSLNPSPKEGAGTPATGQVSLSLSELTKPFKLSGTLANPKLAIDPTQTAVTIGKAAGGVALLGPVGAAAALTCENECITCAEAIAAAQKGVKIRPQSETSKIGKTAEGVAEGAGQAVKGAGRKLKRLFGR